jgi:hypothetical protein
MELRISLKGNYPASVFTKCCLGIQLLMAEGSNLEGIQTITFTDSPAISG